MEDMSTSLPCPGASMASTNLGEMTSQHMCDSRIQGLLEGLYLTILGHADLGLGEGHQVTHLPPFSRKRQITVANSPSDQREDLAAYLLSFWKEDPAHPVLSLSGSEPQGPRAGAERAPRHPHPAQHLPAAPRHHCHRGQKALQTQKQIAQFGAEGKLGITGAELRMPPRSGRLPSGGRELQASKGVEAKGSW